MSNPVYTGRPNWNYSKRVAGKIFPCFWCYSLQGVQTWWYQRGNEKIKVDWEKSCLKWYNK